jgi:hypothetical protein
LSDLVDYWAGDLDESDAERVELHLLGCDACTGESEAIARIVQTFKEAVPPIVTEAQTDELRARGLKVVENVFRPGERKLAVFAPEVDILIHRLTGMDLAGAERVSVLILTESTGRILFEDHFVPFDRDRGEVLVACQRHFAMFPPDVLFEVRAHGATGASPPTRFSVPHAFGTAPPES